MTAISLQPLLLIFDRVPWVALREIQPERFSTESAKTKLSYKYWIMDAEWFGPILQLR